MLILKYLGEHEILEQLHGSFTLHAYVINLPQKVFWSQRFCLVVSLYLQWVPNIVDLKKIFVGWKN